MTPPPRRPPGRRPASPAGPATDADLTARYQAGDRAALDQLVARYRRFARARARAYFVAGGDADDLEQEALIALVKAAGRPPARARALPALRRPLHHPGRS